MKLILAALFAFSTPVYSAEKPFRLHLQSEPSSLDPNKQRTSSSNYLLGNLYANIFNFDDTKGLQFVLGESCKRDKKANLTCVLKKNLQWSDGSPLTSNDFIRTYKKILDAKNASPRADLLFKIKNAQDIYAGKKNIDTLGIRAPNPTTLQFEFETPDPEFEYNLAGTILAPTKENLSATTGPYKVKEWNKGQRLLLEANLHFPGGNPRRPPVEFLFIEEDTVALQLYEKNELQFLRRLPSLFIPRYKTRKDFVWQPVSRMDYLGFGPSLKDQEPLRKALIYSLNYTELQKIFSSEGVPGCLGLPDSWFPSKAPCYEFDLKKVPPLKEARALNLVYSTLGGDDHKRATEWLQNQWSKNAGLKVHLEGKENKIFLQLLQKTPPDIFRKGVTPDRPTCLAALETFSVANPENYLRLNSPDYESILSSLAAAKDETSRKKWCQAGADYLMKNHLFIPTGSIHFAILASPNFVGWKLNQSNQLDLSNLHPSP